MNEKLKLAKLEKVLRYYEQNLAIKEIELSHCQAEVRQFEQQQQRKQSEIGELHDRLGSPQQILSSRDAGLAMINRLELELKNTTRELHDARVRSEALREDVRQELSRIQSFEKLIESKQQQLGYATRMREQHASDEAYLNSKTRGVNQ